MDDQHASGSSETPGQAWRELIADIRAAARARVETRAEQALDEVRELRIQLSNGDDRLEDGLWHLQQAFERKIACIMATTVGSRGGSMSEHGEQMSEGRGSRAIDESPDHDQLKVDEGAAAELDTALKQLREIKESLSAIDRALDAAFAVIDRQLKCLQQRVVAAMYQRRPEDGASDAG
jgi:hypothetical protein